MAKNEEKVGEKKMEVAKKMFSKDKLPGKKCGICGRNHDRALHSRGGLDAFTSKDEKKERGEDRDKAARGKNDSKDWEI